MKPEKINKLLDKYEQGKTSLEEEQILKKHFAQQQGSGNSEYYPIFSFYKQEREKEIPQLKKLEKPKGSLKWLKLAAVFIAIVAATFFYQQQQSQQQFNQQQAQEAFNQTKKVLDLVANNFQKGKVNLKLLKSINQTKNQYIK